jgi:type I restriction enzyme, S subunit
VSQQVGQANVNGTKLKALAIPLPPSAVQNAICDAAESGLAVIEQARQGLAAARQRAEKLRRAILQRAFSGDLVRQDPSDESARTLLGRIRAERDGGADAAAAA